MMDINIELKEIINAEPSLAGSLSRVLYQPLEPLVEELYR